MFWTHQRRQVGCAFHTIERREQVTCVPPCVDDSEHLVLVAHCRDESCIGHFTAMPHRHPMELRIEEWRFGRDLANISEAAGKGSIKFACSLHKSWLCCR